MKQTKHILLTIATLLCSLTASAHDFVVGGIYYAITSEEDLTVAVTYRGNRYNEYSNEYSGAITIPSIVTYEGVTYSVTSIGEYAFFYCSSLTTITIPEGVTSIGEGAFDNCSSLTAITIPEGVTSIGAYAFRDCTSITSITIPENSQLTSIGRYAFSNCIRLTTINIPESVTSIGNVAFSGCSSLTSITIPESVTSIGGSAFSGCSSLTDITIPASVTSIGNSAFSRCSSLTAITIPEGVTSIGNSAFSSCGLTSITIPEGVTSIGEDAFYRCSSLASIVVAEGNEVYDSRNDCNAIIETSSNTLTHGCSATIIPEGVTSIGSSAFSGRSSLTSITIPESVTSIEDYAFGGCSSLATITSNAATPPTAYSSTFYLIDKSIPVYVPAKSVEVYQSAEYWSEFTNYQPLSSDIASGTCGDNLTWKLTEEYELVIEGTGTMTNYSSSAYVPWYSFKTSIKGVTLSEGVTSIGDYAFKGCSSLSSVIIPENSKLLKLGERIFESCGSLNAIYIPAGVKNIGSHAFSGCNSLSEVHASSIEAWCNILFEGYYSNPLYYSRKLYINGEHVTDLTVPISVTALKQFAFDGCSSLTSVTLPVSLTSIGDGAFSGCNSLSEVHASSIEAWCNILFEGFYSNPLYYSRKLYINGEHVTDLTVPISVTALKQYAFDGCSSLTSVTLPVSLTSIGNGAFSGCSGITNMYCYADNVPSVEGNPFDNSLLESATLSVPENVLANYQSTAPWSSFATIMGLAIVPEQEFSNEKVYTLRSTRAFLLYSEVEGINHTLCTNTGVRVGTVKYSLTEPNLQFSIKQHGDNYYLYSIGAGKYVGASGAYEETPNTVLSMQYVGGDYPWKLVLGGKGMNSQVPNQTNTGIMINNWLKADEGNCYQITEAKKILSSGTCGDNLTWKLTDDYELVIEGTGDMYDYSSESAPWYEYRESIQTITMGEGVTSIGSSVFYNCKKLTSITIPESVMSIGSDAFSWCSGLTSITIPENSQLTSIGSDAFSWCSSLTSITIPENSQLTSIGDYAFRCCSSLTAITLPEGVTSIGYGAFCNCSSLTSITLPENSQLTSIGEDAFSNCSSLTSITLPEGVTSIGGSTFSGCSNLTSITIPENSQLTSIGDYAFYSCSSLTSITFPASVTSIGGAAFYSCSSLTSIVVAEGNEVYDSRNGCNAIIETSSNTLIQGCSTTIIPEGVTSIGSDAFSWCSGLTSITIPASVTSIGYAAFSWCSSLTSITIPESVTSIGEGAFRRCTSLTAITIPESVTSIGSDAFAWCENLTSITLPKSVTSIRSSTFSDCSSLTSITIPEGVTSIGYDAFSDCSSLTSITLPESVTSIGSDAFEGCSSLTSITIPEGVTSIGSSAFVGCSSLTSITCEATTPPTVGGSYTFSDVDKSIPVYVPAESIEAYKAAAYWSEFANFLALPTYVADITLSQSEAMLTEGETVTLTATVTPNDVTDKTLTWSSSDERVATVDAAGLVTALAPGTATITVAANDGSGVSASCVVTVKAKPTVRCAAPVMDYVDGQVVLTCDTEGVEFVTDVVAEGAQRYQTSTFDLAAVYTITAYATKEGYLDSDPVTLTLCWVPCTEEHEDDDTDGIITLPAKPVLIQTAGGVITLTGLPDGAEVAVYDTAGTSLAAATAENGTATLTTNLNTGSTAIVKIGGHSVKVVVK